MPDVIMANDLPYTRDEPNPLTAIGDALAFGVDDWGATRAKAWIYGIVLGWDDESIDDLAKQHRWTPNQVRRLRALHERFVDIEREMQQASGRISDG